MFNSRAHAPHSPPLSPRVALAEPPRHAREILDANNSEHTMRVVDLMRVWHSDLRIYTMYVRMM